MANRIWILGASDPEMAAIESLLRECGEKIAYATIGGRRVTPGEAYRAQAPSDSLIWRNGEGTIYAVECDWEHLDGETGDVIHVDHHRPGDPGYGRGPDRFLPASSIGQVISHLATLGVLPPSWPSTQESSPSEAGAVPGYWTSSTPPGCRASACGRDQGSPPAIIIERDWEYGDGPRVALVPLELVLTAAADHCLDHAYAGRCPGVDPDALLRHRVAKQVAFRACPVCGGTGGATGCGGDSGYEGPCHAGPRMTVESVLAEIEAAHQALLFAPAVELDGGQCEWHAAGHRAADDCQVAPGTEYSGDPCWWIRAKDMRGRHIPSLPDAGTRYGIAYVADGLPGPDGRTKTVCSGPADVVRAFLQWAPRNGLVDSYGDPERGFAGAYAP